MICHKCEKAEGTIDVPGDHHWKVCAACWETVWVCALWAKHAMKKKRIRLMGEEL